MLQNLRIALVKQDVYNDIYTKSFAEARDLISSSLRRPGPVGFLFEGADFIIVKSITEDYCNSWKQKVSDCNQRDIDYYLNVVVDKNIDSYDLGEINWEKYDLIISLDASLPKSLAQSLSAVSIAIMPGEPCMSLYRKMAIYGPLDGYDVFLNQEVRGNLYTYRMIYLWRYQGYLPIPNLILNFWSGQIDFPYTFGRHGQLICTKSSVKRFGYAMEFYSRKNSVQLMGLEEIMVSGQIEERISQLSETKFFIVYRNSKFRKLRGNAVLEAALCGCLVLIEKNSLYPNYERLFGRKSSFKTLEELAKKVRILDSSELEYRKLLEYQKSRFDKYVYDEPLRRLMKIINRKKI